MRSALALLFASSFVFASSAPRQEDDLKTKAKKMKAEVKKIRGLDFKSDVTVGVYSRDELLKFIVEEFEKELPRPKAKRYEKAYKHLGLLPNRDDWDLYDSLITLYRDSIAGFYHPKTKELRLVNDGAEGMEAKLMADITLVHELCHAAQDQNFNLVTVPLEEEYNDDVVAAVKCLVEGEASIVGWKHGLKGMFDTMIDRINSSYKTGELPGEAGKLPAYLRLTLTFSYGYGCEFVLACLKGYENDWTKISKMYEDLPSSSEQVLHPEKYWKERDYPQVVTLPLLPKDWQLLCHNVHGEFPIRVVLRELKAGTKKEVEQAAAGWDGDRYYVYEREGKVSSVWYSTWDSEKDAKEFVEAYQKALGFKHKGSKTSEKEGVVLLHLEDKLVAWLEQRGSDVLVLDGDAKLTEHADRLWKEAKKEELKTVERFKAGSWTCEEHPKVDKDTNSYCPECGKRLTKERPKKDSGEDKPKKDYR